MANTRLDNLASEDGGRKTPCTAYGGQPYGGLNGIMSGVGWMEEGMAVMAVELKQQLYVYLNEGGLAGDQHKQAD